MAGVNFAGIMQLLGHKSPHMTLAYLTLTQLDLQREYHTALEHPRHLAPFPCSPLTAESDAADLPALFRSLRAAQHVLEMVRRAATDDSTRRRPNRLGNRLTKIIAEVSKLNPAD